MPASINALRRERRRLRRVARQTAFTRLVEDARDSTTAQEAPGVTTRPASHPIEPGRR
jgi:hypothetical protein